MVKIFVENIEIKLKNWRSLMKNKMQVNLILHLKIKILICEYNLTEII